jgi:NAD-dependent deacetylase
MAQKRGMVTTPGEEKLHHRMSRAAEILWRSKCNAALTGAGISVESGIPDFRSPGGFWERYHIMEYGTISAFRSSPEKVWKMLAEMEGVLRKAKPNRAHTALGRLEQLGFLEAVITQNIDDLHQQGGSRNVIAFHGNAKALTCLWCHRTYSLDNVSDQIPPLCTCGKYLKPDVILFGEAIPEEALNASFHIASTCQVLLVIGTSAQVVPASTIPNVAKRAGASIIEINVEPSLLTPSITHIFLQGSAGDIVSTLVEEIERLAKAGSKTVESL